MFINRTHLLLDNPTQLNYGVSVTDIDGDGAFEWFVAGFNGAPNLALKWAGGGFVNVADPALADIDRQAIGVAACDIDGDGDEELYVLNTDTFAGQKRFADRLYDRADGEWTDLFALDMNRDTLNLTAGRSVACVDRDGDGIYGFFVANYGGPMRLYELDEDGKLHDVAPQAKLALVTGGRSVVALPLITRRMDIFAGNELGANFLFRNNGDGTFDEIASQIGLADSRENARGVTVLDVNGDGLFDLVWGNWEGPHRMFAQPLFGGMWRNVTPPEMAAPSRVRTVIAADFDNDGHEEIFFNNIGEPNRLFGLRDGRWRQIDIGEALERSGLGTGAAVGDLDGDGRLELLIAHGESGFQPLSLYQAYTNGNHFLRVRPYTAYGAPARGALVTLNIDGQIQKRVIDAGSGYLCQMEPVAHFGLGARRHVDQVEVRWLDDKVVTIDSPEIDGVLDVAYPG